MAGFFGVDFWDCREYEEEVCLLNKISDRYAKMGVSRG